MANTLKFGNGTWATKKGSTLAYNDENDRYKPLPFTTTRASGATRVNKQGLIEVVENDRPRIDYTDSADGALLLEPQRSNLVTYSEDFNNASWLKTNLNITKDIEIAPNGFLNASKILQTVSGGYARINTTFSGSETFSLFVKKGDLSDFKLFLGGNSVYFDLQNGVVLSENGTSLVGSKIESFKNDWYKCSLISNYSGSSSIRFQGTNGTNDSSLGYVYVYGAQLEQGSYASSYIPTQGSTVTRVADTASGAGNSEVFNDSEGVLFADIKGENDGTFNYISLSDGGTTNYVGILYTDTDNQIIYRYYVGGSGVQIVVNSVDVTNFNKISVKWKANDFAIWINGFELGTATSGSLNPSGTFNELAFARGGSNNTPFYGKTKQLAYYNTVLTDEELEYLTSYRSLNELVTELNLKAL